MAAYRLVYDSCHLQAESLTECHLNVCVCVCVRACVRTCVCVCHLQADCQEPGSVPEPYARQSSTGYLTFF